MGVVGDHMMVFCRDIACTVDHVIQLPTKLCGWGCKMAFMQHREGQYL